MWLDWTFSFPLLNGMFQPLVYIFSFERLREVCVKIICCERSKEGKRTVMVLSVFRAARTLSGNFVDMDNKNGGSTQKPRSDLKENIPEIQDSRKCSVVSQVTILSENEILETVDTSKPSFLDSMERTVKPNKIFEGFNSMSSESQKQSVGIHAPILPDAKIFATVDISPS